jgi:uncharacterized protein YegL
MNNDKQKLYLALVIDESGSMSGFTDATLTGANKYLADQRSEAPDDICTVVTFAHTEGQPMMRFVREAQPLREIRELGTLDYQPNGGTPLYDAIGLTIAQIDNDPRSQDRKVVITVITDGQENQSKEFNAAKLRTLIEEKEKAGWTLFYLGDSARQDAYATQAVIGNAAAYTVNTTPFVAGGLSMAYNASSSSTSMLRRAASASSVSANLNTTATQAPISHHATASVTPAPHMNLTQSSLSDTLFGKPQ